MKRVGPVGERWTSMRVFSERENTSMGERFSWGYRVSGCGEGKRRQGCLDCGKGDVRVGIEASGAVREEKW